MDKLCIPETVKKLKRKNILIQEHWKAKKQQLRLSEQNKIGKYQKPPLAKFTVDFVRSKCDNEDTCQDILSDPTNMYVSQEPNLESICKMKNFGSTCWFNSVVQSLFHSNISYKIIEHISDASLYILDPDDNNLTL